MTVDTPMKKTRSRSWPSVLLVLFLSSWVAACSRGKATQVDGGDASRGKAAITRYGCLACHTIPGMAGPGSDVGPPLKQIGTRLYIAGVLANTPQNMVKWLRNPPAVDPRTVMPNLNVTEADAKDMAAYLYTLK